MIFQKLIILNMLRAAFPGASTLLVNVTERQIIWETKDNAVNSQAVTNKESEYLPLLAEAYEFKSVAKIFCDFTKKIFVIDGIGFDDRPKQTVIE